MGGGGGVPQIRRPEKRKKICVKGLGHSRERGVEFGADKFAKEKAKSNKKKADDL